MFPATVLSRSDKDRIRKAHRVYRDADEAVLRSGGTPGNIDAAVNRRNRVQQRLVQIMMECGVGVLDEAFTPAELSEMLD